MNVQVTTLQAGGASRRFPKVVGRPARASFDSLTGIFYLLFAVTLMHSLLAETRPTTIAIGLSHLYETDVLMILFVGLWATRRLLLSHRRVSPRPGVLYALMVILTLPLFTALAFGKPVTVVLRDARTPFFYLGILPMLDVLSAPRALKTLLRFSAVVSVGSLVYGGASWWLGHASLELDRQRVGLASSMNLVIWLMFISIGLLGIGRPSRVARRVAIGYVLATLVLVFVMNDSRAVYVGVLAGLMFLGGILWTCRARLGTSRVLIGVFAAALITFLITGTVALTLAAVGVEVQSMLLSDMRMRRLYSLVAPREETDLSNIAATQRDDRVLGFSYGLNLALRNGGLGPGYGDNDFVDLDEQTISNLTRRNDLSGRPGNVVENLLLTHNSYGWAFGRLGLWLALGFFWCICVLLFRASRSAVRTSLTDSRIVLLGTSACIVCLLAQGFGGGAFFDYTGQGLVLWLVALAVLIRETGRAVSSSTVNHRGRSSMMVGPNN